MPLFPDFFSFQAVANIMSTQRQNSLSYSSPQQFPSCPQQLPFPQHSKGKANKKITFTPVVSLVLAQILYTAMSLVFPCMWLLWTLHHISKRSCLPLHFCPSPREVSGAFLLSLPASQEYPLVSTSTMRHPSCWYVHIYYGIEWQMNLPIILAPKHLNVLILLKV